MQSTCTSELMMSGGKPPASIASATPEVERPGAVADVEQHAALARRPAGLLDPAVGAAGALGNGLKQWVSVSPGRSTSSTSA